MTDRREKKRQAGRVRPVALLALAAAAAAAAGLAAVYGMGGFERNDADAACRPSLQTARRIAPLAHGEVAAVAVAREPRRVPDLTFFDGAGDKKTLDQWRGRAVLLNLWATWCVPCRTEMPALDGLQAEAGGPGFEVVAVNVDTARLERRGAFLDGVGVKALARYADPSGDAFETLRKGGKALG